MLNLNIYGVDLFIKKTQLNDFKTFWDNYDLIIWQKNLGGYTSPNGMYYSNTWGVAKRISTNENGIWRVPVKYVKYFK